MKLIVDRFEGNLAICEKEDGSMISISKDILPMDVSVGDVLLKKNNEIYVDYKETINRKKHIEQITKNMWN